MQAQLAGAQVGVQIKANEAEARENEGKGEAAYVELTGRAEATKVQAIGLAEAKATEALGLARAIGFEAQTKALGSGATAVVAVANAVSEGHLTVVPEVLVTGGGGGGGGPIDGLAATLMRFLSNGRRRERERRRQRRARVGSGRRHRRSREPPRPSPSRSRSRPAASTSRRSRSERPGPGISVVTPVRSSLSEHPQHCQSGGHVMEAPSKPRSSRSTFDSRPARSSTRPTATSSICACGWLEEDHGELAAVRMKRRQRRPRSPCRRAGRRSAQPRQGVDQPVGVLHRHHAARGPSRGRPRPDRVRQDRARSARVPTTSRSRATSPASRARPTPTPCRRRARPSARRHAGTSSRNSHAIRTRSSPSSTSTRQCSGTTPRSTIALFAPVKRIGKRAGIATAGA